MFRKESYVCTQICLFIRDTKYAPFPQKFVHEK
jgi:hypothetical protein